MFAANPHVSQEEIAGKLGISQPSVASRIKKLRASGALETRVGIDPGKMNLIIGKVDITSINTSSILRMFKGCPYFMNGFTVSGKFTLCLFFIAENIATMEAIVNGHLRPHKDVQDVEFNIVINSENPLVVPLKLSPERSATPPCGIRLQCKDCLSFKDCKCNGCPVTGQYQGWLF